MRKLEVSTIVLSIIRIVIKPIDLLLLGPHLPKFNADEVESKILKFHIIRMLQNLSK